MASLLRLPVVRTLHERQLLFPVVVALIVAAVLVHGAFEGEPAVEAADPEGVPVPLARPVPAPAPRRPDLEKTPLTYFDDYWAQLRERVEGRIVLVGPDRIPAVVVMPGVALTSSAAGVAVLAEAERARLLETGATEAVAAEGAEADSEGGGAVGASVATADAEPEAGPPDPGDVPAARPYGLLAVDRDLGFALFQVDATQLPPFELVLPATVPSGAYVAAVTRDSAGRASITPGHLVAARGDDTASGEPSLAVSMRLDGPGASAIVNLDGELVGVAVDGVGPDGPQVLSSSVVRRVVAELGRVDRCRAVAVAPLPSAVLELLGLDRGLLVEQVRADAFVPEPSLRAGDVILEWDGEPVETVEIFDARSDAVEPGTLVRYRVLRGRQRLSGGTVLPGPDCAPPGEPPVRMSPYGLALRWSRDDGDGWRVAAIAAGGVASLAGVELDDLVLAVDGRPADDLEARAMFDRLAERGEPALLTLRRADRVQIVALVPAEQ